MPIRDLAGDAVRSVIRAYHGSPHDFDNFDYDKLQNGLLGPGLYASDYEPWVEEAYRRGGRIYELEIDASPSELLPENVTRISARAGSEESSLRKLIAEAMIAGGGDASLMKPAELLDTIINTDAVKRIEAARASGILPDDPAARQTALSGLRAQSRQSARDAAMRSGVVGLHADWPYSPRAGETVPMKIYSVFDPGRVRILRKYGLLPATFAADGLLNQPQQAESTAQAF